MQYTRPEAGAPLNGVAKLRRTDHREIEEGSETESMPFPIDIKLFADGQNLAVVDDVALRDRILPIFGGKRSTPEERWQGIGTCFRIDPFGTCATAFHVIEDLITPSIDGATIEIEPDNFLAALEMPAIIFGEVSIPQDWWRPLSGISSVCAGIERRPLQEAQIWNASELTSLVLTPAVPSNSIPFLSTHLTWVPQIGDRVLAMGYAGLDLDLEGVGDHRPLKQCIYASLGEVIDIVHANGDSSQPWPKLHVNADWPGGMSGGPVFNEAGNVIGLVSAGMGSVSTATWFGGWTIPEWQFPTVDPVNPGRFLGYAVIDKYGEVRLFSPKRSACEDLIKEIPGSAIRFVSFNPGTREHIRLNA
ncbi:S1 family peptidase [Paracoccus onubensis]|uniref:Serine protease n=1 Tax=Paracoccus onubensis TaxID=1675788 RepID=A0A418T1R4_9RHOB|nr:serine protease [Paracoccus onubensis]RJE87145.1 serine protease [Paracoccus onubensis]